MVSSFGEGCCSPGRCRRRPPENIGHLAMIADGWPMSTRAADGRSTRTPPCRRPTLGRRRPGRAALPRCSTRPAPRTRAGAGGRRADAIVAFPSAADALAAAMAARRTGAARRAVASPSTPARPSEATRRSRARRRRAPAAARDRTARPDARLRGAAAPPGTGRRPARRSTTSASTACATSRCRERVFALARRRPATRRRCARSTPRPNNLPTRPTTFVGREAELAELRGRLARHAPAHDHRPRRERQDAPGRPARRRRGRAPAGRRLVGRARRVADPARSPPRSPPPLGVLVDPAQGPSTRCGRSWPAAACCCASTTASTCSTPRPTSPTRCSPAARRSRSSPRAASRSA